MKGLEELSAQLQGLKLNVDYWDVRVERAIETNINLVDGEILSCTASPSEGAFLRVRKDNFWFYESTTDLGAIGKKLEKLAAEKIEGRAVGGKDNFMPAIESPFVKMQSEQKFSDVSLEEKLSLMVHYDEIARNTEHVASRMFRYLDLYKVKYFVNSVGTQFEYDFNQGGWRANFTLRQGEALFDDYAGAYGSNFSDLKGKDAKLTEAISEAKKFLTAPPVSPGKYRVILAPDVAGVFTHESFGHKSEADFMLGNEEALKEWKIGKPIAAECLSIVEWGGHENTSGFCPVDDDGTPAKKNYLIKNGVLAGRLHSRETAGELGEAPTGNSRAMNFEYEPIVRMTSTYIEPGSESAETIIKKSQGALLLEGAKHGSGLSTFTIAPSRGYLIGADGERKPVRVTVISGSVFETLKNIEAVSSEFNLKSEAIGGCGKMEQWPLPVAFGGPYVVVSEMQVS